VIVTGHGNKRVIASISCKPIVARGEQAEAGFPAPK
jgi:hypothetical protein